MRGALLLVAALLGGCLVDIPLPITRPDAGACVIEAPDSGTGCLTASDGYNCGVCGRVCEQTQMCTEGHCSPTALVPLGYSAHETIGTADGNIYWAVYSSFEGPAEIRRFQVDVDAATTLVATAPQVNLMVADGDDLVFCNWGDSVFRVPLNGQNAAPELLYQAGAEITGLWMRGGKIYVAAGAQGIVRVDRASREVQSFAGREEIGAIGGDATHLYWIGRLGDIYRLRRLALTDAGGLPEMVGGELPSAYRLFVGPTAVSVGAPDDKRVYRIPKPESGCAARTLELSSMPRMMIEDGPYLYVVTFASGTPKYPLEGEVWRLPIAGGEPLLLLPKLSSDYPGLVLRPSSLYALENDYYKMLRIPR